MVHLLLSSTSAGIHLTSTFQASAPNGVNTSGGFCFLRSADLAAPAHPEAAAGQVEFLLRQAECTG